MSEPGFDTLSIADKLVREFAVPETQAKGFATVLHHSVVRHVATRNDLLQLEQRLDGKFENLEHRLVTRQDGFEQTLTAKLEASEQALTAKLEASEQALTAKLEASKQALTAKLEASKQRTDGRLESLDQKLDQLEQRITERMISEIAKSRAEMFRYLWIMGGSIVALTVALNRLLA